MDELFRVTHKDGTPWEKKELMDYASLYLGMAWDRLDGFAIDEDGNIYIMDRCGHYVVAPDDCMLVMHERTCHGRR